LLNRFELTTRNYAFFKFVIGVLIIAAGVHSTVASSLSLFLSHSEEFLRTSRNFANPAPRLVSDGRPVTVLVYVGESTTSLNMGLYGYQRDTTPRLVALAKADPNLLVFQKVFSTHVQTSPSLLEALSFALDPDENWLPIHERRRLSIVDLLAANGLPVRLFSTQGMTGTVNEASSILFRRARAYYAVDTHTLGNLDGEFDRPFDDAVFAQRVPPEVLRPSRSALQTTRRRDSGHGDAVRARRELRRDVDVPLWRLSASA
jgi:glucan phosphoethanolaminetransferase (alkaline phosphatase superfamily)